MIPHTTISPFSIPVFRLLCTVSCLVLLLLAFVLSGSDTAEAEDPDYGNDIANAQDATVGTPLEGNIDPGTDLDYFKIDLSGQTSDVDLWVYAVSDFDSVGTLWDSSSAEVATSDDSALSTSGIDFLIAEKLAPGIYYVSVGSAGDAITGAYTLHTTIAGAVSIDTDASGDISQAGELDFFKLDLSNNAEPEDVWVYTTGGTDTYGQLLDADGNRVAQNDDSIFSTEDGDFTIAHTLNPAVYYVLVGNAAGSTGAYTLKADAGTDAGARIREVKDEPALTLGTPVQGIIGPGLDQDTYRLVLNSKTYVIFYTETDGLDTIGALFDGVGGSIEQSDDSDLAEGETDFFIGQTLEPDTYYISVVGFGLSVGPYRLHVAAVTDPLSATAITLDSSTGNGSALGFLNEKDDTDEFTFTPSETTDVFVYTAGPTDTAGSMGSVSNDDGGFSVGHKNFLLADNVSGSRTVTVRGSEGDTGPYRVFVETAADQGATTAEASTLVDFTSSSQVVVSPSFGVIHSGADADWFKLDLSHLPFSVQVLLYTTGGTDTKGTLLDSSGIPLSPAVSDDDSGVGLNFLIGQELAPAVYYLKVEGYDSTEVGPYALFAEFPLSILQVAEPYQSNPPAPLVRSIGSPHAQDWFTIDLSARNEDTDVYISSDGVIDSFGRLYDSNLKQIAMNDDSDLLGRSLSFNFRETLAPGVYYLNVSSFGRETGSYWVSAKAASDPVILSLGETRPGTLSSEGELDHMALDLGGRSNVILFVKGITARNPRLDVSGQRDLNERTYPGNEFLVRDNFTGTPTVTVSAESEGTYTIQALYDANYTGFVHFCTANTSRLAPWVGDDLYACQWHLEDQATGREEHDAPDDQDINVEAVWVDTTLANGIIERGGIKGQGINVAVVDDGLAITHPDLISNVDRSLNWDYGAQGNDHDGVDRPGEHHGTAVAGVIAARDNSFGVRGVAPRATIYSHNFLVEQSDFSEYDSMIRNMGVTAVSNNSWGPIDGAGLGFASRPWEKAVERGITSGYGGRGVFYAFAAGNGGEVGDDANLDEYANFYAVTGVCAVNGQGRRSTYSEAGASLWVCAPSSDFDRGHRSIVTTENSNRYRYTFGGTSAATPQVAGVAALMRQANPQLTWRDVKLALAATARKVDPEDGGWETGGVKYGSTSEQYNWNRQYGFGVLDAKAAVDAAKAWVNLPPLRSYQKEWTGSGTAIPDAPATGSASSITMFASDTEIEFIEFVEVRAEFTHPSFRDLEIELTSPATGNSVMLVSHFDADDPIPLNGEVRFGASRFLGGDPTGAWTLTVTDKLDNDLSGSLDSWTVKIYGHKAP